MTRAARTPPIRILATPSLPLNRRTLPRSSPGQSYPPVEPTYADPVTTDPWAESSETRPPGDVAKDEAANVAGTAAGEGKAVAGTAVDEGKAVTGTAVQEGKAVAGTAVDAGKNVAGTAKQEAANVAAEAGQQAKSLLSTATSELRSQAGTQQGRLASTLKSYADELHGLVDGTPQSGGPLTDLAHQAAEKGSEIARWLEDREPADVLEEVRGFARRRPVAFLGLCALAGVLAGRVTRGAVAANTSVDSPTPSRALTDRPSTDVALRVRTSTRPRRAASKLCRRRNTRPARRPTVPTRISRPRISRPRPVRTTPIDAVHRVVLSDEYRAFPTPSAESVGVASRRRSEPR